MKTDGSFVTADISFNSKKIINLANSLSNSAFSFTETTSAYMVFALIKYTNPTASLDGFIFGQQTNTGITADFHTWGSGGGGVNNAIMSLNWATPNTYNNFYLNGVQT